MMEEQDLVGCKTEKVGRLEEAVVASQGGRYFYGKDLTATSSLLHTYPGNAPDGAPEYQYMLQGHSMTWMACSNSKMVYSTCRRFGSGFGRLLTALAHVGLFVPVLALGFGTLCSVGRDLVVLATGVKAFGR